MAAKITIVSHHEGQREVLLDRPRITIGRKAGNDLQFNRPEISSAHCAFLHENEEYYISDLGSTNGTLLNGARLVAHQSYALQEGDVITIAPYKITFNLEKGVTDTMEEIPGESERGGTGTILDVRGKVRTGTEEFERPQPDKAPVEVKPESAPQPPAPQPPPRVAASPAQQSAAAAPQAATPEAVPVKETSGSIGIYVWLAIGAIFVLAAIGLILLILTI
jgi:predicted component of type VI protein secretion system